ncbi:MAG: hypothetical protein HC835_08515 [Oscillatoriales cyanobacterium RM2_1_1]|nr:hypothetical protein [Oscillatoriales cyanobacterium SM2_3_0]NJO45662.1 hypothetical protein [Oscillatoriales cyanobacterium RM2_1_1]
MPKLPPPDCIQCATDPIAIAKVKPCWAGQPCHGKRSYYRHRDRWNRKRCHSTATAIQVELTDSTPFAVLQIWQNSKETGVHGIGAEIWVGQKRKLIIEPVHTFGLSQGRANLYVQNVLEAINRELIQEGYIALKQFQSQVKFPVEQCQIRPCPNVISK